MCTGPERGWGPHGDRADKWHEAHVGEAARVEAPTLARPTRWLSSVRGALVRGRALFTGGAQHGHGAGSLRATRCPCWDFGRQACRGGRGERLWWRSNLGLLDPLAAHGVVLSYGDGTRLGAAFAKFQNDARGRAADARRASGGARRSGRGRIQHATPTRAQSSAHERLAVRMQGRWAPD